MSETPRRKNFLSDIIEADLEAGKNRRKVVTRFPPEPNGFLHIGHAKSIVLNFGLALQYGGRAHLRFDDTNPTAEDEEYVGAIQQDVRWLGYDWGKHLHYASDYFDRMYDCAVRLVRAGKAYVDNQDVEAIRKNRGDFGKPGIDSPFRQRPAEENLDLFRRMREGEFPDGSCVLRAKIDMSHPNLLMRDPLLYRIRHAHHHRTGDAWRIYPMYDFAHPLEDAFEGVTHSFCTLEFESNRELYDWVLDQLGPWDPRPRQYEFARLALGYTVMSKRKLLQLVTEKRVSGWDDPRMPTIAGMRRRGVPPEALRDFAELIGVAKNNSIVDIGKLEFAIRNDLERRAPRALAVLNPLPVAIKNWPEGRIEELDLPWWPDDKEKTGSRTVPVGGRIFLEREDFSESPPDDWKRLAPGRRVRLIGAFVIRCEEVIRAPSGEIQELQCTYEPRSKDGSASGGKVAGALNWVEATRAAPATIRLYDRLFDEEQPDGDGDFMQHLNPNSLIVVQGARVEPSVAIAQPGTCFQFLRQGYFTVDTVDSHPGAPVFNRVIGLKSTWASGKRPPTESKAEEKKEKPAPRSGAPKKGSADSKAHARSRIPALAERFDRYQKTLQLPVDVATQLTSDLALSTFFDSAMAIHPRAETLSKWLLNDLLGLLKEKSFDTLPIAASQFGRFVALVDEGKITQAAGKTLLARMIASGGDPEKWVQDLGLQKMNDAATIEAAVARVLEAHAEEVARYRAGERKLLGVLIGAAMRETGRSADAAAVRKVLAEKLG